MFLIVFGMKKRRSHIYSTENKKRWEIRGGHLLDAKKMSDRSRSLNEKSILLLRGATIAFYEKGERVRRDRVERMMSAQELDQG